jgi:hypothetical protein
MHNSVLEHFITAKQGGQSALSAPVKYATLIHVLQSSESGHPIRYE